ncbi:GNAT family N-acetyltransferase [Caldifermentibacillus hisashii]|uniref:GNAT family N-acetyltransferase n=1 Tax=Bacillales TaxID=1385 RepID=UPI001FB5E4C6|nr:MULTISPECIES: GNAT family N-acetyltransferase [Bacillales]MDL0420149.1 GNAT family N-acetyltransferase [Caldibacillus thermoamylovorans]MED3644618.1 GNAT family N-acetyltransferase [Caldifermentibacillus hisashii]
MIIEINSIIPHPSVRNLLSYATSINKVDIVYDNYIQSSNQQLFGFMKEDNIIGCIGVEINLSLCEIKHIAVSPKERGNGIGSKMINFLCEKYSFTSIIAETDTDAVEFYRNFGFKITSLGEKYPGVERFLCEFKMN